MNAKIISFFLLFFVSYILAIFFAPKEVDEMASFLGFLKVNESIRSLKSSSDNLAEGLINPKSQLKSSESGSVVGEIGETIQIVDGYTDTLQNTVKNTREVIQTKKQQVENVANTIQRGAEVIDELKQNTNALLEFSGSSLTGSTASFQTISSNGNISTNGSGANITISE